MIGGSTLTQLVGAGVTSMGKVRVKGRDAPVDAWLLGVARRPRRLSRARARAAVPRERGPVVAPFRFDRTWEFPVPPDQLWAVLNRTDQYPSWWSWLREFETDGFEAGTERALRDPVATARTRFGARSTSTRCASPRRIVTTVTGDLDGPARLEVRDGRRTGCTARLVWSLTPGNPMLRNLARVGRPAMIWAHDRVVATGVDQFRRRALLPDRDLRS